MFPSPSILIQPPGPADKLGFAGFCEGALDDVLVELSEVLGRKDMLKSGPETRHGALVDVGAEIFMLTGTPPTSNTPLALLGITGGVIGVIEGRSVGNAIGCVVLVTGVVPPPVPDGLTSG